MNDDDILARVIALATSIAGPERTPEEVGPDTPLTDGGFWLDSVALVEVIVACEAEFFVEFDSEEDLTSSFSRPHGGLGRCHGPLRGPANLADLAAHPCPYAARPHPGAGTTC